MNRRIALQTMVVGVLIAALPTVGSSIPSGYTFCWQRRFGDLICDIFTRQRYETGMLILGRNDFMPYRAMQEVLIEDRLMCRPDGTVHKLPSVIAAGQKIACHSVEDAACHTTVMT